MVIRYSYGEKTPTESICLLHQQVMGDWQYWRCLLMHSPLPTPMVIHVNAWSGRLWFQPVVTAHSPSQGDAHDTLISDAIVGTPINTPKPTGARIGPNWWYDNLNILTDWGRKKLIRRCTVKTLAPFRFQQIKGNVFSFHCEWQVMVMVCLFHKTKLLNVKKFWLSESEKIKVRFFSLIYESVSTIKVNWNELKPIIQRCYCGEDKAGDVSCTRTHGQKSHNVVCWFDPRSNLSQFAFNQIQKHCKRTFRRCQLYSHRPLQNITQNHTRTF